MGPTRRRVKTVYPPDIEQENNAGLIAEAFSLWYREGDVVLDPTWGKGNFYTVFNPPGLLRHDLETVDGVDFRNLPEENESVDVAVFDPGYVSTGGRDTSTVEDFNEDYGIYLTDRTPEQNSLTIRQGIFELYRVLRYGVPEEHGGILMVKTCNYISGTHFFPGHRYIILDALAAGFVQVDEFVLVSGTGPQPLKNPDGSDRRQMHARRAHSFLSVFQKIRF